MSLEEKREKTEVGDVSLIPVCRWSHEVPQMEKLYPDPLGQGQTTEGWTEKREKQHMELCNLIDFWEHFCVVHYVKLLD